MWIVAKIQYGVSAHPTDKEPNMFYDVSFHEEEVSALRRANADGGKALEIRSGMDLDEAYRVRSR
jgi:hypothetical protein